MYKFTFVVNNHSKGDVMQGIWEENEVRELFKEVEASKEKNMPIKQAFVRHAEKFARKPNSVRNYYYHEVDTLSLDKTRAEKLGIDLSKHQKNEISFFSEGEEKFIIAEIDRLKNNGMSVRRACLTLAKGNAELMLRYQNKYRNRKTEKAGEKVIAFKKPPKGLSDEEVQSLFMGLVRLVKKNALLEGEEKYRDKLRHANEKLKSLLARIALQEREIDKIKQSYLLLRKEKENGQLLLARTNPNRVELMRKKFKPVEAEENLNKNV